MIEHLVQSASLHKNVIGWCRKSTPTRRRTNQHQQLIRGRVGHRNLHRERRRDEGCDVRGHALSANYCARAGRGVRVLCLDRDRRVGRDDVDCILGAHLSNERAIGGKHVHRQGCLDAVDGVGRDRQGRARCACCEAEGLCGHGLIA